MYNRGYNRVKTEIKTVPNNRKRQIVEQKRIQRVCIVKQNDHLVVVYADDADADMQENEG